MRIMEIERQKNMLLRMRDCLAENARRLSSSVEHVQYYALARHEIAAAYPVEYARYQHAKRHGIRHAVHDISIKAKAYADEQLVAIKADNVE